MDNYYVHYKIPKSRRGYVLASLLPLTINDPKKFMVKQQGPCCILNRCYQCKKLIRLVVWVRWMNPWFRCPYCMKAVCKYVKHGLPWKKSDQLIT